MEGWLEEPLRLPRQTITSARPKAGAVAGGRVLVLQTAAAGDCSESGDAAWKRQCHTGRIFVYELSLQEPLYPADAPHSCPV